RVDPARPASAHLPAIFVAPAPAAFFARVHRLPARVPAPAVPPRALFSAGCRLHRIQALGGGAHPSRPECPGLVRSRRRGDKDAGRDQHETELSHLPLPRLPWGEPIPPSPALPPELAALHA